jgi:hypothetical protein
MPSFLGRVQDVPKESRAWIGAEVIQSVPFIVHAATIMITNITHATWFQKWLGEFSCKDKVSQT